MKELRKDKKLLICPNGLLLRRHRSEDEINRRHRNIGIRVLFFRVSRCGAFFCSDGYLMSQIICSTAIKMLRLGSFSGNARQLKLLLLFLLLLFLLLLLLPLQLPLPLLLLLSLHSVAVAATVAVAAVVVAAVVAAADPVVVAAAVVALCAVPATAAASAPRCIEHLHRDRDETR